MKEHIYLIFILRCTDNYYNTGNKRSMEKPFFTYVKRETHARQKNIASEK